MLLVVIEADSNFFIVDEIEVEPLGKPLGRAVVRWGCSSIMSKMPRASRRNGVAILEDYMWRSRVCPRCILLRRIIEAVSV